MTQVTNVTVRQQAGQHLVVQTGATADVEEGPTATGVILNTPFNDQNGGPVTGPFGTGNIYVMNATDPATNNQINVPHLRYLFLTPAGNAQYTTE